jgi:hypothetical protein
LAYRQVKLLNRSSDDDLRSCEVVLGAGGNRGITEEVPVLSWLEGANPRINSLMIAATVALGLPLTAKGEQRAKAIDGIRSAIESCHGWTTSNPCPDGILGNRFEVIVARFGFVALVFDLESDQVVDAHIGVTVDRLNSLNADLRAFLSDVGERLEVQ